jgi:hypothetical protein
MGDDVDGSVIAGGGYSYYWNSINASYAVIGGGHANTIDGALGTIGGGTLNSIGAAGATIGGGHDNTANAMYSTIAGGDRGTATGNSATIGGGAFNTASGLVSTVPGGMQNSATGNFTFAAGYRAFANYNGAFTWGDSTDFNKFSAGANTFTVYASGGVYLYSSYSPNQGSTGVFLPAGSGAWSTVSDRTKKQNFVAVVPRDVLERVASMPVSTWNYTAQDPSIRHMGPMAQDFHAAFGLGEDERHITTIDTDGVLFAAVQGLNEIVQENKALIAQLQEQNAELRDRLERLEAPATTPVDLKAP